MAFFSVTITILLLSIPNPCHGHNYDRESLTGFFHDRAKNTMAKPETGALYRVSLPSNFTGMEVTFVRLRSGSFRNRGADFSSVHFPPNVVPKPFVKRLGIVYGNLGNWSSLFFKVPNYSLIAPVIGFAIYDSPGDILSETRVNFTVKGKPVLIQFDGERRNDTKCVRFGDDDRIEIEDVVGKNRCLANGQGFFSVIVPSKGLKEKGKKYAKWWLIGFGGGFLVVVLVVALAIAGVRLAKKKRLREMEERAQNGVSFEALWVGGSRMPSASMVRTQPAIENEYAL